jgi:hypothetical protein
MTLPKVPLATGTVNVGGTEVPIRALSRLEVLRVATMDNPEAEPYILSCAAGVSLEEATEWLGSVDAEVGNKVAAAILDLSATTDPRVGSTGAGPDAPPSNEP